MQGVWLGWKDAASPYDLSWNNLIYHLSPHLVRFILHSSINWVRTPDLLKLWSYKAHANCNLCTSKQCTIHHILVGCSFALNDTRYTWRHDSVLKVIGSGLRQHIGVINARECSVRVPHISHSFVRPGQKSNRPKLSSRSLLDGYNDWEILVDFSKKNITFPPEIWPTPERPDIVILSRSAKIVFLIELTCPAEEGIANAAMRKQARYHRLKNDINTKTLWSAEVFNIEVGARGFVAFSLRRLLSRLGIKNRAMSRICKDASNVSARCSYAIFLASSSAEWQRNRPLLTAGTEGKSLGDAFSSLAQSLAERSKAC